MLTVLFITSLTVKQRHRNSADRSSDDSKAEWQTDNWRRNSNRWPPGVDGASPTSDGGETPPTGGVQTPPSRGTSQHQPSLQQSTMPSCPPPPIPAPPPDPQDDLSKHDDRSSPVPWWDIQDVEEGLNNSVDNGTALLGTRTPTSQPSTPRSRRRQTQEQGGALAVPGGGRGPRSRSSSPYEVWGTPDENWGPESNVMRRSPSPAPGKLVRQRQEDSSGSEVFHTEQDASQATDADAYEHNSHDPVVHTSSSSPPAVADEWMDLLDDALGYHADDDDDTIDPDEEFDFESGKNPFYQTEAPAELYQSPAISYIPSSKQEFLRNQQKEDEKYIMAALNEERDVLLRPFMEEKHSIEELEDTEPYSLDNDHTKTDTLNVSDNEEDERAWSPGSPIFKRDLEQHRLQSEEERPEVEKGSVAKDQEPEEKPWWEDDCTTKADSPPPWWEVDDQEQEKKADSPPPWWEVDDQEQEQPSAGHGTVPPPPPPIPPPPPPPLPFLSKVHPSSTMSKIRQTHLDSIKKAVRTRPDWHALMQNLEDGIKLRHVTERSDRSKPVLPGSRGKNGKFVYDSEKPMVVNELLHEIQRGVKLRRTRTDDRSKPDFAKLGVKKIRRQLTLEEKQKVKPGDPEALPSSSDDDEDIDNMRDDLTATKSQLADEIIRTKKHEREKNIMQIDIESLNAEVKRLKRQLKQAGIQDKPLVNGEEGILPKLEKSMSKLRMSDREDLDLGELDNIEDEVKELNGHIDVQRKRAEGFENKVYELEQKLTVSDSNGDEWEGRAIFFEKKYKGLQRDQNIELPDIAMASTQTDPIDFGVPDGIDEPVAFDGFGSAARKSGSRRSFASQISRMESFREEMDEESSSSSEEESEEEEAKEDEQESEDEKIADDHDEGDDEAKEAERANKEAKRLERDRELWQTKLDNTKGKEANVKKERNSLRERIRKYYNDMYKERVDYLKSKSELDELVGQLKDPESEVEDEDDEEEEEEHGDDEPGWWFDKPNLKPKKLKKKKNVNADGEEEEEEEEDEEDLEDLTQLEAPCYSDSEQEESEPEDENDSMQVRLNFLQSRTRNHEQKMNGIKKNNYLLKAEVDRCKERYNEERLRHKRLDEELNIIVSDMQ